MSCQVIPDSGTHHPVKCTPQTGNCSSGVSFASMIYKISFSDRHFPVGKSFRQTGAVSGDEETSPFETEPSAPLPSAPPSVGGTQFGSHSGDPGQPVSALHPPANNTATKVARNIAVIFMTTSKLPRCRRGADYR